MGGGRGRGKVGKGGNWEELRKEEVGGGGEGR